MSEDFNLDEVLESALEDFEEDEKKQENKKKESENKSSLNKQSDNLKGEEDKSNVSLKNEEEVKKLMESLTSEEFDKTLEEITKAMANGDIPDFKDLNLENFDGLNEEMLEKLAEEIENKPEMHDIMNNMMSQLVSKDILYEPMKEISVKYPEWLSTNRDKISEEEYNRYCKHAKCVSEICLVYEKEPNNTDKVVALMQQMQNLGQPPLEMIQSLAPELELTEEGLPSPNMMPELLQNSELAKSCSIM